jgi:ATP-binding cassette subfamily C protein CydC
MACWRLRRQPRWLGSNSRIAFSRAEAMLAAIVTGAGGLAIAAVIGLSTAPLPLTLLAGLAAAGAIEALGACVRSSGRDAVIAAGLGRLASLVGPTNISCTSATPVAGNTISVTRNHRTLTLERGDRLVIAGRSGSGKTSLLECLAGLREAGGGDLAMDDIPLAHCPPEARRPLFALSPQDAQLLGGTIGDNLRIARPALTDAMLWHALEVACLSAEIQAMPEGLATWVGDGGARLSGGQRKRLSLARALLAGRPWLLLDEPSEGLDPPTETQLRENLHNWLNQSGSGLILVTHRKALLSLADQQIELPD